MCSITLLVAHLKAESKIVFLSHTVSQCDSSQYTLLTDPENSFFI